MIEKVYEVSCDYCSACIIHGYNSIKDAEEYAKEVAGAFVKGGKHFCNELCYNKYKKYGKSMIELNQKEI